MNEKTYEMVWDCEYCGQTKLLGLTHRYCANCGAPQNPNKRYFPSDSDRVAVQDHRFVGADRHCPACREPMSAAAQCCTNCGSPLEGGAAVAQQALAAPPAPKKSKALIIAIVAAVLVSIIAFLVVRAFWTKEAVVTVRGHSWRRAIDIERFEEARERGPCSRVPSDARVTERHKAEPECKTVKVDQGDGTYKEKQECTEPVEQCSYTVKKWARARTLEEKGDGLDSQPRWPEVKLARTGSCDGCEREGSRNETYTVVFSDGKDEMRCDFPSAAKWSTYAVGSRWRADQRVMGGDLDCDSLKAAQ